MTGIDDDPRLPEVLAQASRERQYQYAVFRNGSRDIEFYNGFAN